MLRSYKLSKCIVWSLSLLLLAANVSAQSVKITPLGSHDGEFCSRDRAMILEDPNGTRILYDAGQTVAGAADKRLGDIDIVLVSHMHGDHIGNQHIKAVNAGSCAKPDTSVSALPASNSVNIALIKKSKMVTGSEMPAFLANKLEAYGGDRNNSLLVRFGASILVDGVSITTVPAVHANGIAGHFIEGELGKLLTAAGLSAYAGPPTGYVLTFSNGLVVYLSGDTGITAEQRTVVGDYYQAKLAVMNIGDTYTNGPREAAYVVNELIKPVSVIASHANEAATIKGKLQANTRSVLFKQLVKAPVYMPLSGKTMEFTASGECSKGC